MPVLLLNRGTMRSKGNEERYFRHIKSPLDEVDPSSFPTTSPAQVHKLSRAVTPDMASNSISKAYRLHFSCKNKGRYFRSSKRKIRWVFGFANLSDLKKGKRGSDCRGEEHEVELIWSVKSGKIRVFWNKRNISVLFREQREQKSGLLQFAWKTRSDETLQIVAHSSAVQGVDNQYDLLVDGTSFFRLPPLSEIGQQATSSNEMETKSELSFREGLKSVSTLSDMECWNKTEEQLPEVALDYRLSMVGLNSGRNCEVVDELHSELYSASLDTVRCLITESLPQTEELVSRAIMDAFIAADDSFNDSLSSSSDSASLGAGVNQIEANALWEAFQWTLLNVGFARRDDADERALVVMQKHITGTFARIRDDELSPDDAVRILLNVAAVLGLEFAEPIPNNTVLVRGVPSNVSSEELREIMSGFGYVDAVGIARGSTGFAFCRYLEVDSAGHAYDAFKNEDLLLGGETSELYLLSQHTGQEIGSHLREVDERREDTDDMPSYLLDDILRSSVEETTNSARSSPSFGNGLCAGVTKFVSPRSVSACLDFSHVIGEESLDL